MTDLRSRPLIEKLIGFDTTSHYSNLELMAFVQDYLTGHGVESQLVHDSTGTKANLYATLGPTDRGGIMLSGHTDVVPVDGQDWATEGPRLRDRIVAALEATLLPGLADTITAEFAMTPEDFRRDYDAEAGAGFSLSPRFTQSAWFRYHNRGEGLADLYVVGAGPHPGAGVPGVLNSARTLERLLPARP